MDDKTKRIEDEKIINTSSPASAKDTLQNAATDLYNMNYSNFTNSGDYADLAKRYRQQGQQAMKDTLGQVSARTGGYASSYATQAAQQSYNGYMEKLEDAARSLYDSQRQEKLDAFNVANSLYQQEYNEGRDSIADQRYNTEWQHRLDLEEKENTDLELEGILGGKSFDWNTYDWNGGGEGNGQPSDLFAKSSYGEDYWKTFYNDAQTGYAKEDQLSVSKDIQARIANGESLEDIASDYEIADSEGGGTTWESLTGKSKAEWMKESIDNTFDLYESLGAEGISNTRAVNGALTGSEAKVFDHYYGKGAYDNVKSCIKDTAFKGTLADAKNAKDFGTETRELIAKELIGCIDNWAANQLQTEAIYDYIAANYPSVIELLEEYIN